MHQWCPEHLPQSHDGSIQTRAANGDNAVGIVARCVWRGFRYVTARCPYVLRFWDGKPHGLR